MYIGRVSNLARRRRLRPLVSCLDLRSFLLCVMQLPSNSIQKSNETGFADAPPEKRIRCQRPEGVVTNLGVCWRGPSVDKG